MDKWTYWCTKTRAIYLSTLFSKSLRVNGAIQRSMIATEEWRKQDYRTALVVQLSYLQYCMCNTLVLMCSYCRYKYFADISNQHNWYYNAHKAINFMCINKSNKTRINDFSLYFVKYKPKPEKELKQDIRRAF